MSSTTNFNYQELQDFLFESPIDTNTKAEPSKTEQFDFSEVWQDLHAKTIEDSHMEHNNLSTFVGDITPAAAAIVAAEESPMMATPFLDHSCMNTPFTPATIFTPSVNQFHDTPYYSPYIESNGFNMTTYPEVQTNDDSVDKYLKNDVSWQLTTMVSQTPILSANDLFGSLQNDPAQLLLDSTKVSADNSSDSLFPPLPSSENNQQDAISYSLNNDIVYDPQALDASNLFDDHLFDIPEADTFIQPSTHLNNKRKYEDLQANKPTTKRTKLSTQSQDEEQRRFKCDQCNATFNRRYNLGTHIKTHDKNRVKDFACTLCQKPFDRKHDLSRHVATVHNGERAHKCSVCTSTFSRKDALVRHQIQKHAV
ncbi:hypothetical protein EDC96DRAFT_502639 [Choanephora cucurbitarum]|nr:hypothetical protein EDC96DRAFT_502639 [Choanephora cucurbitarum]